MKGIVLKKIADQFYVYNGTEIAKATPRGILKKGDANILVGDFVELSCTTSNELTIEKVEKRKNELTRPPISNLDNLIIVITRIPAPDLNLVDKLIIKCNEENICPILVISKADILDDNFILDIKEQYKNVVDNILVLSSFSGQGKEELLNLLKNKTSSLVGQSAVGKSSIMNMLGAKMQVGEVSEKSGRGKNTTRHSEIVLFENDVRLADTAGFSRLILNEINYKNLMRLFTDFLPYSCNCQFNSCVHINEQNCAVKKAVAESKINQKRYTRYVEMYKEQKTLWDRRFK